MAVQAQGKSIYSQLNKNSIVKMHQAHFTGSATTWGWWLLSWAAQTTGFARTQKVLLDKASLGDFIHCILHISGSMPHAF